MRYFVAFAFIFAVSIPVWGASTQDLSVGSTPRHVLTADVNNDTNLDLIVCSDGGVSIARGAANGTFGALTNPAGSFTASTYACVGLFNADALLDLAIVNPANDQIEVFLNTGNATTPYNTRTLFTTGDNPVAIVAGDFNGDGFIDLATANLNSNNITVFTNNGSGSFPTSLNFGAVAPVSIAIGDLNGDSRLDIVTASTSVNGVSVLYNQGSGLFGKAQNIAVGSSPTFVDLRDLNGDGRLDIVALIDGSVNILFSNGDGTFQAPVVNSVFSGSSNFSFGDLTQDGITDLVLVTLLGSNVPSIFLLEARGNGLFNAATEFQVNGTASFSVTGDFNKDGQIDVAFTFGNFGSSTLTVRLLDSKPVINTIAPTGVLKGAAATSVTITGTKILNGARVRFGNNTIVPTTVISPTSVTFSIPSVLLQTAGRVDVSVFNSDASGSGVNSKPLPFSIYEATLGSVVVTNTFDSGMGSLRKALQNAQPGDTVSFDDTVFNLANSDAATVINVLSELPALDDGGVIIDASNQRVSVNGSGAGSARGLSVVSTGNTIRGLSLVGFARSGISVTSGAKSNTIGGSRSTGTGPNGQGLRIANCGTFGVEISGAGTDGNVVKGCFIGLDSSGLGAQGNLAGVLISGAATNNTIGGTGAGEVNTISGNFFEGVTISDVGTDGNATINNVVGAAAIATLAAPRSARISSREVDDIPRRAAIGNGSTGVFISKGTQNSSLGGITDGTSNTVANNGGNGLEVRTAASRRNASRGNRVGRNQKGGIALFDGSNDGITPPKDDSFAVVARVSSTRVRVRVQGTVSREGSVELFSDPGSQGSIFAVRNNSAAGRFDIEAEVNDGENVTATLTDADGNTSAFQVLGPGLDSDGDGVTDLEEDLAGTNKASASDVPILGGSVTVDKAQAAVSFAKTGGDSVKLSLRIDLPAGYTPSGSTIGVKFAGVAERLTLVSKGSSAKGPATVKVKGTAGSTGVITFSVKKDLRAGLSQGGLVDSTTAGVALGIPVAVTVDTGTSKTLFSGSVNMTYKATQGKSGKAAIAK